jgi:AcrR family transcriptional regulator
MPPSPLETAESEASAGSPDVPIPSMKKVDRTRLRLVQAVRSEVEATGSFTAEVVARRAGSSPATFYNHFASKEEALAAVFGAAMDDLVAFVRAQLMIERVLEFGLESFASQWVLACCAFFRENSMVFAAAQMQFPVSKSVREIYREQERAASERFVRFVRLGQAAQVIRRGDTDAMGQAMMVTAQGWNNPAVLRMKEGDALHGELVRTVVRMLGTEEARS